MYPEKWSLVLNENIMQATCPVAAKQKEDWCWASRISRTGGWVVGLYVGITFYKTWFFWWFKVKMQVIWLVLLRCMLVIFLWGLIILLIEAQYIWFLLTQEISRQNGRIFRHIWIMKKTLDHHSWHQYLDTGECSHCMLSSYCAVLQVLMWNNNYEAVQVQEHTLVHSNQACNTSADR